LERKVTERAHTEIEIGWMLNTKTEFIVLVRDNHVGFNMNYAGKLFGVFQRLHRADESEGVGIGLANVRRVINWHGGLTWRKRKSITAPLFTFHSPNLISKEHNYEHT
jgi:chemotaxis family two-component system sensor kinase Cph1